MRYYLGLLLAWTAQRGRAIKQFKKVVALGPTTGSASSADAVPQPGHRRRHRRTG